MQYKWNRGIFGDNEERNTSIARNVLDGRTLRSVASEYGMTAANVRLITYRCWRTGNVRRRKAGREPVIAKSLKDMRANRVNMKPWIVVGDNDQRGSLIQ